MADKKYILVSMEDEKADKIAEIIGNKTCKKIINLLADRNLSEKEMSEKLNIPLNTLEYNLKKLLDAGFAEKTKNFFWSKKGKKIETYRISNKSVIISPKNRKIVSQIKTILPVVLLSGIASLIIRKLSAPVIAETGNSGAGEKMMSEAAPAALDVSYSAGNNIFSFINQVPPENWFFIGACFAIIIFIVLIMLKSVKGGNE
jgi:DNA-binding transcriptional ArsR family regulator